MKYFSHFFKHSIGFCLLLLFFYMKSHHPKIKVIMKTNSNFFFLLPRSLYVILLAVIINNLSSLFYACVTTAYFMAFLEYSMFFFFVSLIKLIIFLYVYCSWQTMQLLCKTILYLSLLLFKVEETYLGHWNRLKHDNNNEIYMLHFVKSTIDEEIIIN